MNSRAELDDVRQQIAQVVAHRESLKLAIEKGEIIARKGFRELVRLDARLSKLDSQFKLLWDAANARGAI